jgi:CRP-like cAMP-binding protein
MAGLGNSGRLNLAGKVEIREFEEGDHIVQEGEAADCLYLIREGQCVVWRKGEDGSEEVLAKLGPGQTFGEIGLLFQKPRSATVTCLEPTTVIEVTRAALDQALRQSFHVGLALERLAKIRLEGAA